MITESNKSPKAYTVKITREPDPAPSPTTTPVVVEVPQTGDFAWASWLVICAAAVAAAMFVFTRKRAR
ncbi:MAG TPA: hypothetical protein VN540_06610 [Clostridia bacterium]|nr:hypothetical protein [Clostridia bacterium]